MKKKALIFYISRFTGHYHAARAVEKGLLSVNPDAEVKKINTFEYTNPILGRVINKAYTEIIKKKPEIWGNMYDNPEVLKKITKARDRLHKFNRAKIKKIIEDFSPDVAICTQAFPAGMIADYKSVTGSKLTLISVLTDHAPHSYWLFDEVDFFVVPEEKTGRVLIDKGVSSEKIKPYGIPVDPKFSFDHGSERFKKDLGINDDDPVVLIMGGNQGLGCMDEIVGSLLKDDRHNYQLIVVTGANKRLFYRLTKLSAQMSSRKMIVLSHVDNIDEIMQVSDIIVTKAGGMTTAESLIKELPIILVSPIPGQERFNADFLVKSGVAIEVEDLDQIHIHVNRLFDDKDLIGSMTKKTKKIARPASALDIARLALGDQV